MAMIRVKIKSLWALQETIFYQVILYKWLHEEKSSIGQLCVFVCR